MIIYAVLLIMSFFGVVFLSDVCYEAYSVRKHKTNAKKKFHVTLCVIIVCVLVFVFSMAVMLNAQDASIMNATKIATFEIDDNPDFASKGLFFDSETNEYFVVKYKKWVVFDVTFRFFVPSDIAIVYAAAYEQIESINFQDVIS